MPNLANLLKDEIRRLAKKETKVQLEQLRKASAQYRKDIAALKRDQRQLERKVAALEAQLQRSRDGQRIANPKPAEAQVRFSPSWVSGHRAKLGLSQAEYAELVGVSAMTIYNWEKGYTRPAASQLAAWGKIKKLGKRQARAQLGAES